MKIRQQHYVWRHYLSAWENDGQLHASREGRTFTTSAANVAKQRDFYRLRLLTPLQIELVRRLAISISPPFLRDMHERLLATFSSLPRLHAHLQSLPEGHPARAAAEAAVINTEEHLQTSIEQGGADHLRDLRRMDASFFENEDSATDFLYFLCMQYLRTKNIQKRVGAAVRASKIDGVAASAAEVEQIWPVLRHIFAVNAAYSLFADRAKFRIVFLSAPDHFPFITGDQPVLNALGQQDGLTPPTEFEPYYPLGPGLALLLTARDIFTDGRAVLSQSDVANYNNMIARASYELLFSSSEEALAFCRAD
ncbi:MAG TPA: DUF4238 domain-containing protein [Allosphingosinicella sp.]|jgi:hypothetical protein